MFALDGQAGIGGGKGGGKARQGWEVGEMRAKQEGDWALEVVGLVVAMHVES